MKDGIIPDDKYEYYLDIIFDETKRLALLTNNIVDMGKTQENVLELEISDFDLNDLIREVLDVFEQRFKKKNLICKVVLDDKETMVKADREEIHRVLHNLIDNAVKFTPDGGTIEIETTIPKNEHKVYVAVSDNGCGIPENQRRKVFEAFYKTDESRGCDKTGSGLGLCAAKEIINAHGEIIVCKESEMGGAKFEFTLKLSEE